MTLWLERKEKIMQFNQCIQWRLKGCPNILVELEKQPENRITMTKHPTKRKVSLADIATQYGAIYIRDALAEYSVKVQNPTYTSQQIKRAAATIILPSSSIAVYHRATFWLGDPEYHRISSDEFDVIQAKPAYFDKQGKLIAGRFDTVLVDDGHAQYIGIDGMFI